MTRTLPALALLVFLAAAGCNGKPVTREPLLHDLSRQELVTLVNHNGRIVRTLQDMDASIIRTLPNKEGELEEQEGIAAIWYERGGKLRLHVGATGLGVASIMALCTDGETVWIHQKKGNEKQRGIYREKVNKLNRIARTGGLIRPEDLVSALALEPVDLADPSSVVLMEEAVDWDGTQARPVYYLSVGERDLGQEYLVKKYAVDRTNLQLVRQWVYERSGRVALDIRYGNFEKVVFDKDPATEEVEEQTIIFPKRFRIEWPPFRTTIVIELDEPLINLDVHPDLFNYPKREKLSPDYEFKRIIPE